jgi:hypothetical protein
MRVATDLSQHCNSIVQGNGKSGLPAVRRALTLFARLCLVHREIPARQIFFVEGSDGLVCTTRHFHEAETA